MLDIDRALCAENFLVTFLTPRERKLLTAFALGFNQTQVAHAWGVSAPVVSRMCRRIERKANRYWHI